MLIVWSSPPRLAPMELNGKTIWIAGETGLVGAALLRRLAAEPVTVLSAPHDTLDLTRQQDTHDWLMTRRPDIVVMAAARVGGIGANAAYPASFIADNLSMAHNIIDGSYRAGVSKLLFLGSSCMYPREAPQPIAESALLSGPLEPTNEAYAVAKIAGLKMCQAYRRQYGCNFIAAMPTNLYGPGDRFDKETSHVIPALMLKIHEAKVYNRPAVELWGTGTPLREFLYADDLADALVMLLKHYSDDTPINIGSGEEVSISALAVSIADVVGYRGNIVFNDKYPDGTPRKRLDCSRLLALGWRSCTSLREGLRQTYDGFLARGVSSHAA